MQQPIVPVAEEVPEVPFFQRTVVRVVAIIITTLVILFCCCLPLSIVAWSQRNVLFAPWQTETSAPTTREEPVSPAPSLSCLGSATIISQSSDWTVVVVETNGRIWNPCLLDGSIRPAFTTYFTAPASGSYTFNGVNASLQENGKVLAENVNGQTVSIVKGKTYTVVNGAVNGGFELLPLQ